MRSLLERCGYDVVSAGDVAEASAALLVRRPDLLVMDLALPGMDGRDGAEVIRGHLPGLPILFVSGHTNEDWFRRGHGPEAFLRKPFSVEELLGSIERVLDGRDWDEASEA